MTASHGVASAAASSAGEHRSANRYKECADRMEPDSSGREPIDSASNAPLSAWR